MKKMIGSFLAGVIFASTAVAGAAAYGTITVNDNSFVKFKFDGVEKQLPAGYSVLNYQGRTYVPARFVAEQLGAKVDWDAATSTVLITSSGKYSNAPTSSTTSKNPFYLNDAQIRDAISEGKNGGLDVLFKYEQEYGLPVTNKTMSLFVPEANISTAQSLIAPLSALRASQYKEYSFQEAKSLAESMKDHISFRLVTYGDEIDFGETFHVVLKQGDKIIQPLEIDGLDEFADLTDNWPDSPAYTKTIYPIFPVAGIDFSKNATLTFVYVGNLQVDYEVDFSLYK